MQWARRKTPHKALHPCRVPTEPWRRRADFQNPRGSGAMLQNLCGSGADLRNAQLTSRLQNNQVTFANENNLPSDRRPGPQDASPGFVPPSSPSSFVPCPNPCCAEGWSLKADNWSSIAKRTTRVVFTRRDCSGR
jgi:hypothetical protein